MKRLFVFLKDYIKECILGPLFKLIEASFELAVPLVVAWIIDKGIGCENRQIIWIGASLLVLFGILGLVFSVTAQYFSAKAAVGFAAGLRHALFEKIQSLTFSDIDEAGTAALITGMTSDVNTLQNGVNLVLRLFLRSPFIVFGAAIMAFFVDVKSAFVFVVVIPSLAAVVFGIMLLSLPMYKKVQKKLERVLSTVSENLSGARVIRAFCTQEDECQRFFTENGEMADQQKRVGRLSALTNPITYIIINGAIIALIFTGAIRVDAGIISVGAVVALYNYMSQILVELIKLANLIITVTRALASGSRVAATLDMKPTDVPKGNDCDFGHEVLFSNVCLKYRNSGDYVLENISFCADKGDVVGIIGGTGSGKTSLVNLIPRFYDANEGVVAVGGRDVRLWDGSELSANVGVAFQKAVLFKGTVRDNMLWGNENASDEQIKAALKDAQALEFTEEKGGLDAPVEQGGRNFSGGQRQRLALARALVRRPRILILDDSSSALDFATDAAMRQAIASLDYSPTVFIVSQRASCVMNADRIVVLDDGKAVGVGRHGELLKSCEVYREIYDSQFDRHGENSKGGEDN